MILFEINILNLKNYLPLELRLNFLDLKQTVLNYKAILDDKYLP